MTDLTTYRRELRAGLADVTTGPWESDYGAIYGDMDKDGLATVASTTLPRGPLGTKLTKHWMRDAAHIARCSPDRIAALLDALDAAERERDEALATLATYRADNGCTRGQRSDATQFCAEAVQAMKERDEARAELADLKRRVAVGSHPCPDWDSMIVRPGDPESECCTYKREDE